MASGTMAATQLVVDAWTVLAAAAAIVVTVLGTGLSITFHLGGRIDRLAEEVALVRERVARLEGSVGTPDPGPLQLA